MLRFIPINGVENLCLPTIFSYVKNKLKSEQDDFWDYYDLDLDDNAFGNMEVTMSPQFTEGNRLLLEALKDKYNTTMNIRESMLHDKIR